MDARMQFKITTSWPPTVNHIYQSAGKKRFLSTRALGYRQEVIAQCVGVQGFGTKRLYVQVNLFAPNKRRWDLDNRLKAVLDSLQHAGIYVDDSQIDRLLIIRGELDEGKQGRAEIIIQEI